MMAVNFLLNQNNIAVRLKSGWSEEHEAEQSVGHQSLDADLHVRHAMPPTEQGMCAPVLTSTLTAVLKQLISMDES